MDRDWLLHGGPLLVAQTEQADVLQHATRTGMPGAAPEAAEEKAAMQAPRTSIRFIGYRQVETADGG